LSALAKLFLSPFHRTIRGFLVLLEVDWLTAGHKFAQRYGQGDRNYADEQRAPIFLQFMDCVWQCMRQYPCSFEFNERLLLTILDEVYNCQYGTFLCNNERERDQACLQDWTVSLWAEIHHHKDLYVNPFYLPGMGVIYPSQLMEEVQLWPGYYLRFCRDKHPFSGVTTDLRAMQLTAMYETMRSRCSQLEKELTSLRQIDQPPGSVSDAQEGMGQIEGGVGDEFGEPQEEKEGEVSGEGVQEPSVSAE
jgi:hypothetical protein